MGKSDNTRPPSVHDGAKDGNSKIDPDSKPRRDDEALPYSELVAQAAQFLQDESIKSASREKQASFLQKKGLKAEDIEKLLDGSSKSEQIQDIELKTIHDSTTRNTRKGQLIDAPQDQQTIPSEPTDTVSQRDSPPIITYPEFLLRPQKAPPLVTLQRLIYATYGLTGISALTYGASRYVVEPMQLMLSDARHELAVNTLENLEKLNQKLEFSVSHVPYSATLAALKAKRQDEDDLESLDSDPTELFHRDIATQTSPRLSRSSSSDSLRKETSLNHTNEQVSRLEALHETIESLIESVDPTQNPLLPPTSSNALHDTVSQFQALLDKLESTYNPFRSDYNSIYSSLSSTNTSTNKGDNNEAAKFKAEIRSLKGAFLSSRNFPAARPSGYGANAAR